MEKINVTQLCRELRKNMTDAEKLVWEAVKSNQIKGLKFRRQHPIFFHYENKSRFFITDFYCGKLNLVIKIDGQIHREQKTYDNIRDTVLNDLGYSVIRIKNEDIFKSRNKLGSYLEETIESQTPSLLAERGNHE